MTQQKQHRDHHHKKEKRKKTKSPKRSNKTRSGPNCDEAPGTYHTSESRTFDDRQSKIDNGGLKLLEDRGLKNNANTTDHDPSAPPECSPRNNTNTINKTNGNSVFLHRKGKTLEWQNVSMSVKQSRKQQRKGIPEYPILKNISGTVKSSQVTALMGPSGSGKTSLLKVLTGRAGTKSKAYNISGQVLLDDQIVNPTSISIRRQIAYVEQEFSIPHTSTPREAIQFSARLRLDKGVTNQEIEDLTNEILEEMGLANTCADTMIGGSLSNAGLSGGEKKRTSVGVELVVRPSIIILDEPTSGLDSFSAEQLVTILQRVAKVGGSSVLLTIHQPSPPVLRKLDHMIMLCHGQIMYDGNIHDIPNYFASKGFPMPNDYNVADWIMTVAQSESEEKLQESGIFEKSNCVPNSIQERSQSIEGGSKMTKVASKTKRVPVHTEIRLLFSREIKHLIRDKASLIARIGLTAAFGLFFGLIYLDICKTDLNDPLNLQAEFGAITNLLISTLFGVAQAAMLEFPKDRPVFLREYSTNHYRVIPYFIAKLSVEGTITFGQVLSQCLAAYFLMSLRMPFILLLLISYVLAMASTSIGVLIGSLVEDPKVAAELMPVLIVPQLMFSGFFISTDLIPSFLRWAQYLCSLTYAVRLSLKYEFEDCDTQPCIDTLERNSVYELDAWIYWIILVALFAISRISGMVVLRKRASFD